MKLPDSVLKKLIVGATLTVATACQTISLAQTAIPTPPLPTAAATVATAESRPTDKPARTPLRQLTSTPTVKATPMARPTDVTGLQSTVLFERNGSTWVMDGDGARARPIAEGFIPWSWSPSGRYLLLQRNCGLYVAEADGSNPQLLYEFEPTCQIGATSGWLTDDVVLVELRPAQFDPRIYYLDVNTGELRKPEPDYQRSLEAISPAGRFWIQFGATNFEITDLSGSRVEILQDFEYVVYTTQPFLDPNIVILPSGQRIIFRSCVSEACHIYLADINGRELMQAQPIFDRGYDGVSNLSVSPDGHFLSFLHKQALYFLDLETNVVAYHWPWNDIISGVPHLWSPDSRVIIYRSWSEATGGQGIVKLDIQTGHTQLLLQGMDTDYLHDWRYIKLGD